MAGSLLPHAAARVLLDAEIMTKDQRQKKKKKLEKDQTNKDQTNKEQKRLTLFFLLPVLRLEIYQMSCSLFEKIDYVVGSR
jgi:hypothetical protein